jgi:hypothetical protein
MRLQRSCFNQKFTEDRSVIELLGSDTNFPIGEVIGVRHQFSNRRKPAHEQATWRAGRRELYGFAVVSADRAGMVRANCMC